LYDSDTIIPWRPPAGSTKAPKSYETAGPPSLAGKRRPYCSFVGSRRGSSTINAWSIWQPFHAFGNDLAELHHLLAQSRIVYDVAVDAFAIGAQLFTQVVQIADQCIDLVRRIAGNSLEQGAQAVGRRIAV